MNVVISISYIYGDVKGLALIRIRMAQKYVKKSAFDTVTSPTFISEIN